MSEDNVLFEVSEVEWKYTASREKNGYSPPELKRTGLISAICTCKTCKHKWHAQEGVGRGQIYLAYGAYTSSCPACHASGKGALVS